jgi:cytochrome b
MVWALLFTVASMNPPSSLPAKHTVRVWDLPTRLFHWLLLAAVVGAVTTAKIGGNAMVWHGRFGAAVLALLAFRLLWGVVGGLWSRFVRFVPLPGTLVAYVRGRGADGSEVGHNPLGALSVLAMLAILIAQVATGLVADDEISVQGPLNRFVETATGLAATGWHKGYGQWVIYGLVGLHVAAILFYRLFKKQDLIGPIVHGDKALHVAAQPSRDDARSRLLALLLAACCVALAVWVMRLGLPGAP